MYVTIFSTRIVLLPLLPLIGGYYPTFFAHHGLNTSSVIWKFLREVTVVAERQAGDPVPIERAGTVLEIILNEVRTQRY